MPSQVYLEYRKNLEEFEKSEKERREADAKAIELLLSRQRTGFKVPGWLATLGALAALLALLWAFRHWVIR